MQFEFKPLPFSYDSLEPYIDEQTLKIHHDKHHQSYLDKFISVVDKYGVLKQMASDDILKNLNDLDVSEEDRQKLKNYGGGFVNHNIYWAAMGPEKEMNQELKNEVKQTFGSVDRLIRQMSELAKSRFGSGWVWLARDQDGNLQTYSLPNQDSPYTLGHEPVFNIDLWEHAYYLKYQNQRGEYVDNWWRVFKLF